jgi:hypothetical protein
MLRLTVGRSPRSSTTASACIPRRTQEAGFRFEHPEIDEALASLFGPGPRCKEVSDERGEHAALRRRRSRRRSPA